MANTKAPVAIPDCRVCALSQPLCPVLNALEKVFQWKDFLGVAWALDAWRLSPSDFSNKREWSRERQRAMEEFREAVVAGIVQQYGCRRFRAIKGCTPEVAADKDSCTGCKRDKRECAPFDLSAQFEKKVETLLFVADRQGALTLNARDFRTEAQLESHLQTAGSRLVSDAVETCIAVLGCTFREP
jgi:hypothetical protein